MASLQPDSPHIKYRADIDGLRAIAVVSVVLFHAFPTRLPGGFIGVDIFFVISGYLISRIIFEGLDKNAFSFLEFYARRIKRIFPALFMVLAPVFAAGWMILLAGEYRQLGKHIAAGAGFVSNIVFWNEAGYFDNSADTKPLLHLWSLGIEEQFYIFWPFCVWLVRKRNFNVFTLTVVVAAVSFILNVRQVHGDATAAFYSPQTRFWELLCGSMLAWLTLYKPAVFSAARSGIDVWLDRAIYHETPKNPGKASGDVLSLIGLAALIYGLWKIDPQFSFPGKWALLPVGGAVLIIAAGSDAWVNRTILSNRIVVWFGLISFPLYLWHWPLLSFSRIIEGEIPGAKIRVAAVGLSIVLAWLTYIVVEKRVRARGHSAIKVATLVTLMIAMGYAGYNAYSREGLAFRPINKMNNGVSAALSYDWSKGFREGQCFLDALNENSNRFSDICAVRTDPAKPLVVLWGDSHAASLYRGFQANAGRLNFDLAQFTASGCPPVLDFNVSARPECARINAYVFGELQKLKPQTLVLAGYWGLYNGDKKIGWDFLDPQKLVSTIGRLKGIGIQNIVLIGPLPTYTVKQAEMLKKKYVWDDVPVRTYRNFEFGDNFYDQEIRDVARTAGVEFISPLDFLCDKAGCLLSESNDPIVPLSFDYGHLTASGSAYVVSRFFDAHLIRISR